MKKTPETLTPCCPTRRGSECPYCARFNPGVPLFQTSVVVIDASVVRRGLPACPLFVGDVRGMS